MSAYYNEIELFAADWLRNLIARGLIAPGDVDTRSIVDVRPNDLRSYTQCHFFAGIGGWSYALRSAGWDDARPVWTGSCPCQPFSLAGKQQGFDDPRHLWPVWRELIRECDPAVVFGEQVASATEWLRLVRSDLEAMGRAVGAMPIQAASAGADHLRDRYWFVAYANGLRGQVGSDTGGRVEGSAARPIARPHSAGDGAVANTARYDECWDGSPVPSRRPQISTGRLRASGKVADSTCERQHGVEGTAGTRGRLSVEASGFEWVVGADGKARRVKPGLRLLAHGVSGRVGKLRGFGNAIDPRPAVEFIAAADEAISQIRSAA